MHIGKSYENKMNFPPQSRPKSIQKYIIVGERIHTYMTDLFQGKLPEINM